MRTSKNSSARKVVRLSHLERTLAQLRHHKQKIVFTNGCFDILHVGHVNYLEAAKSCGDCLVVGLNSDRSVRELKGRGRPVNNQQSRARVLAGLGCVDFVVIFGTKRATPILRRLKPEIYVKGGDYKLDTLNPEERSAVEAGGGKIALLPIWRGYSTTNTLKRLKS